MTVHVFMPLYISSLLETLDCTQNIRTFHLYTITEDIQKTDVEAQQVRSVEGQIYHIFPNTNCGVVPSPGTPENRKGLVF